MKTNKFILFVFLVSIILSSKMVLAQNASSLKTHITRSWTKEFVKRATNPSPIVPPSTNFDYSPSYRNYPYDYYPSYRNNLDAYPPSYRNNLDESWNDYSPCMGLGGLLGGLLAGFDALKTKNKKEKKYPTPKNNHLPLSNNQAWEDNLNNNQDDNKDNFDVITLKIKTYVRSGPSYKNNVKRILLKGEKIWFDKNNLTKAFEDLTIQNKKDELWLELVRPEGWIYFKDFMSNYNNNSSRRR